MNEIEYLNNRTYLTKNRKRLRKNLTPAEATLWRLLKSKQLNGIRFRRQFSIGNYIVDFYNHPFKLAVELDGAGHFSEDGIIKDKIRTEFLNSIGVEVIRFENKLVFDHTQYVVDSILEKIEEIKNNSALPLPPAETSPHRGRA